MHRAVARALPTGGPGAARAAAAVAGIARRIPRAVDDASSVKVMGRTHEEHRHPREQGEE